MSLSVQQQVSFEAFVRIVRDEYDPDEYPLALSDLIAMLDQGEKSLPWLREFQDLLSSRIVLGSWDYRSIKIDGVVYRTCPVCGEHKPEHEFSNGECCLSCAFRTVSWTA